MAKAKKRGRPKGSRNKVYSEAVEIPASCQMCGSTDLHVVKWNKPLIREIAGNLPDGHTYNRVRWDRKKCDNCGQMVAVRSYYTENTNGKPISSTIKESTSAAVCE